MTHRHQVQVPRFQEFIEVLLRGRAGAQVRSGCLKPQDAHRPCMRSSPIFPVPPAEPFPSSLLHQGFHPRAGLFSKPHISSCNLHNQKTQPEPSRGHPGLSLPQEGPSVIPDRYLFNLFLKASSDGDSTPPQALYSPAQPLLLRELFLNV